MTDEGSVLQRRLFSKRRQTHQHKHFWLGSPLLSFPTLGRLHTSSSPTAQAVKLTIMVNDNGCSLSLQIPGWKRAGSHGDTAQWRHLSVISGHEVPLTERGFAVNLSVVLFRKSATPLRRCCKDEGRVPEWALIFLHR